MGGGSGLACRRARSRGMLTGHTSAAYTIAARLEVVDAGWKRAAPGSWQRESEDVELRRPHAQGEWFAAHGHAPVVKARKGQADD